VQEGRAEVQANHPASHIEVQESAHYKKRDKLEPSMSLSAIPPVSMTRYDSDFEAFAQELGTWFERYGFAVVADHGVNQVVIDEALQASRDFFALSSDVKRSYHVPKGGGQRGYTAFGVETAKDHTVADLKEFWHTGRELSQGHRNRALMPPNVAMAAIPGFDEKQKALFDAMDDLGRRVLRAIASYLGLHPEFFDPKVADGNSILRILHYPAIADSVTPGAIRAGAHTDINVITLLLGSEEPGLQLQDRTGQWLSITPPKGCVVINIGDMLSRMTNDRLPSTPHRVVNPDQTRARFARYSTPFFLHFAPDVVVETMEWGGAPKYEPITAQAFLEQRLSEIKLT
jgi:isopenicillin N synthase-like dioxygenase